VAKSKKGSKQRVIKEKTAVTKQEKGMAKISLNKKTKTKTKTKIKTVRFIKLRSSGMEYGISSFLSKFKYLGDIQRAGKVISVCDGVAKANGLLGVRAGEMVLIGKTRVRGLVLSLEHTNVGIVVFGNDREIYQGAFVLKTNAIMSIPLSIDLFGRVIDGLGNTIDGGPNVEFIGEKRIDTKAVGIMPRESVREPMQTGIKCVDSITPIGCGQRELIIGDRQTGKSTIATDTILNQKKNGFLYCIYVAIGQKKSTVAQIVQFLKKNGALGNTVVVSATSAEPATLQYLAPYAGCSLGE
jgi:proton translocating ATP synthase F1 alpha subunit